MVPNLLPREHLVNAFALQSMLGTGSAIIGPVFLPLIEKIWGIEGVFMTIGVAYAFTAVMFSKLSKQEIYAKGKAQKPWQDLIEGFSYIRQHRVMIALISIGIVAGVFTSSYSTLLPVFAEDILGGDVQSYGYLLLSGGIGGMVGAIAMAQFAKSRDSDLIQATSGVGLSLTLIVFALSSNFVVAVITIAIVGAFGVVFSTINNTFLQHLIADEYRGRVSSIHQLGWGASAFGGLLLGFLAQTFGPQFGLSLCGSIATVSILALCFYIKKTSKERIECGTVLKQLD
jgi:predicted MFS family arabinose efflux permease